MVTTSEISDQKSFIDDCIGTIGPGETWYLIDSKWYNQWKKYVTGSLNKNNVASVPCGEPNLHPGPIDNSGILQDDGCTLKPNLIDELDYTLVSVKAWNKLVEWYGHKAGQTPISRQVIVQGKFMHTYKVEVYFLCLKLCTLLEPDKCVIKSFSRMATIKEVETEMRTLFHVPNGRQCKLWSKLASCYEHIDTINDMTLQDLSVTNGSVIFIEVQKEDGGWSETTSEKKTDSNNAIPGGRFNRMYHPYDASLSSGSSYSGSRNISVVPGACGLSNLGNTCFMNSALQCLSNVPKLTEYFLSDRWRDELNPENPLGMRGELAKSYAELIGVMWNGYNSYTVPRNFKIAVGRFAPQFSGFQQQDSQELMAFLLDGLHEDLNRIKKKPYIELKEAAGRKDADVAAEAWKTYRLRNDSIIVDTFHGLLKSTLVCPECNKVSITFDPFCYLSLPLPQERNRLIEVTFFPRHPKAMPRPMRYKVLAPIFGCIRHLCSAVAKVVGNLDSSKLIVCDIYNHRFHKIFSPDESLSRIQDRDEIFVYQVAASSWSDSEWLLLPLYQREKVTSNSWNLFGTPMILSLPREEATFSSAYQEALRSMSRYVRRPAANEGRWWKKTAIPMEDEGIAEAEEEDEDVEVKQLFELKEVNSWGSSEIRPSNSDSSLNVRNGSSVVYLSADWHPAAQKKFFDMDEMARKDEHESMERRLERRRQVPLSECLNLFTTKETLGKDDPWFCPTCKKHQQASKKFDLWDLPEVLVIHLKRFSYDRYLRSKIDCEVQFPLRHLDLSAWVINSKHDGSTAAPHAAYLYDLIAVSNHYGGLGGGHYTAYARNARDQHWRYFDDNSVSEAVDENEPCQKAGKSGYVLIYMRSSNAAAAAPRETDAASAYSSHISQNTPHAPSGNNNNNMENGACATSGVIGNGSDEEDDDDDPDSLMDVN